MKQLRKNYLPKIVGLSLCFLLQAALLLYAPLPAEASTTSDTEQQAKYGSHPNGETHLFVTDGKYFYYSELEADKSGNYDNCKLIKQSINGTGKTILCSIRNCTPENFNLMDGWIYFSNYWMDFSSTPYTNNGVIYRVRTDGTNLTKLYSIRNGHIANILLVEDKLYFRYSVNSGVKLASMNLDGSNPQVLYQPNENFSKMTAFGEQIFMLSGRTVICYDIKNKSISTFSVQGLPNSYNRSLQVSSSGRLYSCHIATAIGDTINAFYSFNLDGSGFKSDYTTYEPYVIVGEQIYYYESDGYIYRTSLQGGTTPARVTSTPMVHNGKYFTYSNGYIYTFDFKTNGQRINKFYKVDDSSTRAKTISATPTASKILVNGRSKSFGAYTINGNNYFKLRDLAYALNGSGKQFEVTWDSNKKAINLISGKSYTSVGGEMSKGDGTSKTAQTNTSAVYLNSKPVTLTAYTINGNNYFKLRDLGQVFDFGVTWDSSTSTISIDTTIGYAKK